MEFIESSIDKSEFVNRYNKCVYLLHYNNINRLNVYGDPNFFVLNH